MTSIAPAYQPVALNGGRGAAVSQATAIEQSRAIAEVQAAVVVAQSCQRDMQAAEAEMEYVCGRMDMAEQAFYSVKNRGNGPSVHLMRELARIWGNVDYGVKELARSDSKGESEVQAFAWDMQRNTRSSRTFIVPHQRMAGGQRKDLTDLGDIYLNNQNIGARAVRECIATILPRWFAEKAIDICQNTLERGDGEPLQDRIATMVDWFEKQFGVSVRQIETRIGKKRGQWDASDVAQMKVAGASIKRGEAQLDELFPPEQSAQASAAEILAEPEGKPKRARAKAKQEAPEPEQTSAEPEQPVTEAVSDAPETSPGQDGGNEQSDGGEPSSAATPMSDSADQGSDLRKSARASLTGAIFSMFGDVSLADNKNREDRLVVIEAIVGRPVKSSNELTDDELQNLRNGLFSRTQAGTLEADINDWLNLAALKESEAAEAATTTEGN